MVVGQNIGANKGYPLSQNKKQRAVFGDEDDKPQVVEPTCGEKVL